MAKNRVTTEIKMNVQASLQNANRVIQDINKIADSFDFGDKINKKFTDAQKDLAQLAKTMERLSLKNVISDEDINSLNKMSSATAKIIGNVAELYDELETKGLQQFSKTYIAEMERISQETKKIKQEYFNKTGKDYDKESKKIELLTNRLKEYQKTKQQILSQEHKDSLAAEEQANITKELEKQIAYQKELLALKKQVLAKEKEVRQSAAKEQGYSSYGRLTSIAEGTQVAKSEEKHTVLTNEINKLNQVEKTIKNIEKTEANAKKQTSLIIKELLKAEVIQDKQISRQQALTALQQRQKQLLRDISRINIQILQNKQRQKEAETALKAVNQQVASETKAVVTTSPIKGVKTISGLNKTISDTTAVVNQLKDQSSGDNIATVMNQVGTKITKELDDIERKITVTNEELEPLEDTSAKLVQLENLTTDTDTRYQTSQLVNDNNKQTNILKENIQQSTMTPGDIKNEQDKRFLDILLKDEYNESQNEYVTRANDALREMRDIIQKIEQGTLKAKDATKQLNAAYDSYTQAKLDEINISDNSDADKADMREVLGKIVYDLKSRVTAHRDYLADSKKTSDRGVVKTSLPIPVSTLKQAATNADHLTSSLQKATLQTKFMGSAFTDIGNRLSYILSLNFVFDRIWQQFRQAITFIGDLDKDITQIGLVLEQTSVQVWRNFDSYAQMASRLNTTTSDVVGAMKLFYQQGLNTSEVNKMVEASAIAAALGETTMAEASETLTSIINSYNLNASQAIEVTDKISSVAIESAADFNEMSTAIEKVASSAASAGLDLDHMMGYLAKIIETTREAPTNVGTALKTIVANFSQFREDPNALTEEGVSVNDVDEALKTVGVELLDSQGNMRDLGEVIDDLGQKWDGLNRNTKAYLATIIAGTRQQSRFYALMNDYDRTLELVETSTNSTGQSTKLFNIYQKSFTASTKRLKNEIEKFYASLTGGEGILRKLTDVLASLLNTVNQLPLSFSALAGVSLIAGGRSLVNWFGSLNATLSDTRAALLSLEGLNKSNIINAIGQSTGNAFAKQGLGSTLGASTGRFGASLINKIIHVDDAIEKYNKLNDVVELLNATSLEENEILDIASKGLTYQGTVIQQVAKVNGELVLVKQGETVATATLTGAKVMDNAETEKSIALGKLNTTITWAQIAAKLAYIGIIALGVTALWGLNKVVNENANAYNRQAEERKKAANKAQEELDTTSELINEYVELTEKMIRTNEEQERLLELRDQIAAQNEALIIGYDKEGKAILANNNILEQHLKTLEEEAALKRQQSAQTIMGLTHGAGRTAATVGSSALGGAAIGAVTAGSAALIGAKMGAAFGTAITPGLGTAIGAGIGLVAGLITGAVNNTNAQAGMTAVNPYSNTSFIWGSSEKKEGTFYNDELQEQAQKVYALIDAWGAWAGDAKIETMLAEGKYDDAIKRAKEGGQDLLAAEIERYKEMAISAYGDMVYDADAVNITKSNLGSQRELFLQDFIDQQAKQLVDAGKSESEIKDYFDSSEWKKKYNDYLNSLKGISDTALETYERVIGYINSGDYNAETLQTEVNKLDPVLKSEAQKVLDEYVKQIKEALSKLKVNGISVFSEADMKRYSLNSLSKISNAYNEMSDADRAEMAKGINSIRGTGLFETFMQDLNELDQTSKKDTEDFKNKWGAFWQGNQQALDGLINYTKRTATQIGDALQKAYGKYSSNGQTAFEIDYSDIYAGSADQGKLLKQLSIDSEVKGLDIVGSNILSNGHEVWESMTEGREDLIDGLLEIEENSSNKMISAQENINNLLKEQGLTIDNLTQDEYNKLNKEIKKQIDTNLDIIKQEKERYNLAQKLRKEKEKESQEERGIRTNQYVIGGVAGINNMITSLDNLSDVYDKLNTSSMTQLEIIQLLAQDTTGELLSALDVEKGKLVLNKTAIEDLAETRRDAAVENIDTKIAEIDAEIAALKANDTATTETESNLEDVETAHTDLETTVETTSENIANNFSSSTESQINDINQLLTNLEKLRKAYIEVDNAEAGRTSKTIEAGNAYTRKKTTVEKKTGNTGEYRVLNIRDFVADPNGYMSGETIELTSSEALELGLGPVAAGKKFTKKQLADKVAESQKKLEKEVEEDNKYVTKSYNEQTGSTGLITRGTIDISNLKLTWNDDGTVSTVDSFSTNIDGKEILLPTVYEGKRITEQEAIDLYKNEGKHLGIFTDKTSADTYGNLLHTDEETRTQPIVTRVNELIDERERLVALKDSIIGLSGRELLNTIQTLKDAGSDFEPTIEHLEKFYTYLRLIEATERKLSNVQTKQAQLDLTNSYDLTFLAKENEYLKDKYEILRKMIPEQKIYLQVLRDQLSSNYGDWIFFDSEGNPGLYQTDIPINSEAEQKRYAEFDRIRTEYEAQLQAYDENKIELLNIQNSIVENVNTQYEKRTKQLEDQKAALDEIVTLEEHRKDLTFREIFALRYYESILTNLQKSYDTQQKSYKNAIAELRILDNALRNPDLSKWVEFNEITQEWGYSAQFVTDLAKEDELLMAQLANIQSMVSEYEKLHALSETLKTNVQETETSIKTMVDDALSSYEEVLSSVVEQNTEILDLYNRQLEVLEKENDLFEGDTSNLQEYYDLTIEAAGAAKYAMQSYQESAEDAIDSILDKYEEYVTEVNGQYAINEVVAKENLTTVEINELERLLLYYKTMNEAAQESQDQYYDYMEAIKELEEEKRDAIIEIMQDLRDELENLDQEELDDLQKKYDEMNRLDNEYYSSLSQKIADARQKRDRQQSAQDVSQLRNQIAVLERDSSGTFSTELRDLRQQLVTQLQEQADQNIDDELERIEREQEERQKDREIQITQMENLIDFKVENGMYWDQAYALWESGRASVESFLAAMYNRQDLSKEEIAQKIQETNATLDTAWVEYGNINAQKVGEVISPIAENLRELKTTTLPEIKSAITMNEGAIETATTTVVTALGNIESAIREIYNLEDNAGIIEQMMENGKLWADASPEEKKKLNNTNKALGSKAGLTYDAPTGLYYDKYGQAAYNGTDKTQYDPKYDIVGMARASEQMQANGDQWREDMTPSEKNALHEKNVKLAAPYGWYYDPATGIWYTDPTKKQRVYDVYEDGGYVDYTGFAKVDGTPSKPEAFLNAQQTQLFEQLRDSLAGKKLRTTTNDNNNEGDNIIINNLEISVKEIADADSIDKVVKTVKQSIYKDATATSGITKVSRR